MNPKPQLPAEDLGITEEQKENLNKILSFAKAHPDLAFDIQWFIAGKDPDTGRCHVDATYNSVPQTHPCGTSCCLAGMGLQAGIAPLSKECWSDYTQRVYGVDDMTPESYFLFDSKHENSLPAAIRRLEYFLTKGLPSFDGEEDLATFEIPA